MNRLSKAYKNIGPGFMVAAAGIGAGDMVVGIKSGMTYGLSLLWAVVLTVILKYYLTEGIARWQISTGTTIIEGWTTKLPKAISGFFLILLIIWSFYVAGALISACGLAGHAIFPFFSVKFWGIFHSVIAALLVYYGNYSMIENITKFLILVMFLVVIITAFLIHPSPASIIASLKPDFSISSFILVFAILGGIGGSVTMVSYGYWLKEKSVNDPKYLKKSKIELASSYAFTALFVIGLMIIASNVIITDGTGVGMILSMADKLADVSGYFGKIVFLIGFWGVVFSSILCVWQGIPYIFADYILSLKKKDSQALEGITHTIYYKSFLLFMAFPPLLLIYFNDAISNIINYALISTVFVVFLASTLLYLNNNKKWVGIHKNSLIENVVIIIALIFFLLMFINQINLNL